MTARTMRVRRSVGGSTSSFLLRTGLVVFVGLVLWFNPYDKSATNIGLGVVVLALSLQPLDAWLRNKKPKTVPVLELHLLFYAICFGIAAFVTTPSNMSFVTASENEYTTALIATILGILAIRLGYILAGRTHGRFAARLAPRFPTGKDELAILVVYPAALVLGIVAKYFHVSIVMNVLDALRLFAFAWALCAAWSGRVRRPVAVFATLAILPIEVALYSGIGGGQLVGLLTYGELIGVIYALTRGRIPLLAAILVTMAFFLLQPVKSAYRSVAWNPNIQQSANTGTGVFFSKALENVRSQENQGGIQPIFDKSYGRLNHLVDTAAIIAVTDERDNFRYGKTYLPLFTKWVPRFVWPNKPQDALGNQWARDYGFLGRRDYSTSYNLPWLPEMFMNFGWFGILFISIIIGWIIGEFKRGIVDRQPSAAGIAFSLSIGSAFFFPESNLSLAMGGIVIGWVSISLLLACVRIFDQATRAHQTHRPGQHA